MAPAALPETCATPNSDPPPAATLWIRPGLAAYLGRSLGLDPHSTSVHCLVVGVDSPFTVRVVGEADVAARSALIPPRLVHQVVSPPDSRILFCYSDVNHVDGSEHMGRMGRREGHLGINHPAEATLVDLCRCAAPDGAAIMAVVVGSPRRHLDPRIARTLERIRTDPPSVRNAAHLALAEGLSPSYFLRLFSRETGTSFRRYRLWARMLHVARSISEGTDFTSAAMSAGFASPSHFSDSFLRMFGLTATSLATTGANIVVDDAALSPTATATRAAPPDGCRDDR